MVIAVRASVRLTYPPNPERPSDREAELSVELLARSVLRAQIEAVVTASNMEGDARSQLIISVERIENRLDDVYDPARQTLEILPPFNLPDKPDVNNFTRYCNDGSEFKAF